MARQHLDHFSPANCPMMQDKSMAKCLPPRRSPQASFATSKTFENRAQILPNRALGPPKSSPGVSKNEVGALQESKTLFLKTFNLELLQGPDTEMLGVQNGQLGFILEAQEAPNRGRNLQKIDVEKQCIFSIDFGRVRTSFWKSFW